jgi:tetratricopeptide (TPR) repeat protein
VFNLRRFLALFRPELYTPFELAMRDLAQHRYADALARLDSLLADPSLSREQRATVANKRGVALIDLRRIDEAREAFEQALQIDPRFAPAIVNLGNLQLETGDMQAAIAHYERAIACDEEYAPAHHNLGVAYKRLGKMNDAVRALRRAQRLEGRVLRRRARFR